MNSDEDSHKTTPIKTQAAQAAVNAFKSGRAVLGSRPNHHRQQQQRSTAPPLWSAPQQAPVAAQAIPLSPSPAKRGLAPTPYTPRRTTTPPPPPPLTAATPCSSCPRDSSGNSYAATAEAHLARDGVLEGGWGELPRYCSCCCCCRSGSSFYSDGEEEGENGASEAAPLLSQDRPAALSGANTSVADRLCGSLRDYLHFANVFTESRPQTDGSLPQPDFRMPFISRVYVLLNYVAAALTTVACLPIIYNELHVLRHPSASLTITDGTVCHREHFRDVLRPDLTFSAVCFLLNSFFAVQFALRAARYERYGLLLGQCVMVVLQVARVVYFELFVSTRYFRHPSDGDSEDSMSGSQSWYRVGLAVDALLLTAVCLWVAASCLSFHVRASFGWRSFQQGITQLELVALRRRFMYLQTCLQLEGVITVNAYLAMAFLFNNWADQLLAGAACACVLLLLSLLVPLLRHTSHSANRWVLLGAAAVLAATMGVYVYGIRINITDYSVVAQRESDTRRAKESRCYTKELPRCLARDSIVIMAPGEECLNTSTYIPTWSVAGELLEVRDCDAECFFHRNETILSRVHSCCSSYGLCRVKDNFRSYGVGLLVALTAAALVMRVALIGMCYWRWREKDEEALQAFFGRHRSANAQQ